MKRISGLFTIKFFDKDGNPDKKMAKSIYEHCKETYSWFANEGEKGPFLLDEDTDGATITTADYCSLDEDGEDWNVCKAPSNECIGGADREFKWLENVCGKFKPAKVKAEVYLDGSFQSYSDVEYIWLEGENGEISTTRQTPIYDQKAVGWSIDTDMGRLMDSRFDYVVLQYENRNTGEKISAMSYIMVEWDEDSDCEEWRVFLEDNEEYTMLDADDNEITVENWRDFDHFSDDFIPSFEDFGFVDVDDPDEWDFIGLTIEKGEHFNVPGNP